MAGDFTRDTHDRSKQYVAVRMQQGRVQLDADWNEQAAIARERLESETIDVVGLNGAPKKNSGFLLVPHDNGRDLIIHPGRFYVDGIAVELATDDWSVTATAGANNLTAPALLLDGRPLAHGDWVGLTIGSGTQMLKVDAFNTTNLRATFTENVGNSGSGTIRRIPTFLTQPNRISPALPTEDGRYIFYLDVWDREVSALDDPSIREVALGGPDTAGRIGIVWQVRWTRVADTADCNAALDASTNPSTGRLTAWTTPPPDDTDPCFLPPTAGYRGLENQLYRVEVHRGGTLPDANPPTFKWSINNGSVVTSASNPTGSKVTVHDLGRDQVLGFADRQWVELVDDATQLEAYVAGQPNPLSQIDHADESSLDVTMTHPVPVTASARGLQLRRWDMPDTTDQPDGIPMTTSDVSLGSGISVRFAAGTYHSGDYWLIPARSATRQIIWPGVDDGHPVALPPQGIRHHYARLALVQSAGGVLSRIDDCRKPFPALTDICAVDVCFDNSICEFPSSVKTVQQAIDELCRRTDLRLHNKYLHGWGVVCGLQLACNGDLQVLVKSGYAIDCEGFDIWVRDPQHLALRELPGAENLGASKSVCLTISRGSDGRPRFAIVPHETPGKSWRDVLAGSLLVDYYNKSLDPLARWYQENLQLPKPDQAGRVSEQQRNFSALFNVLIQLSNPKNGRKVFLSLDEHLRLNRLYDSLSALLKDPLNDPSTCIPRDLGAFPPYPFSDLRERTIYAKDSRTKVRLHPKMPIAYAFGTSSTIDAYNTDAGEIDFSYTFPDGFVVQDVAVSQADAGILYAVARKGDVTMFGTSRADRSAAFTTFVLKDRNVPTIVTTSGRNQQFVYGVDLNGALVEINPTRQTVRTITDLQRTKPTGQLVFDGQFLFALANSGKAAAGKYDQLVTQHLPFENDINQPIVTNLDSPGSDDLDVTVTTPGQEGMAWIVIDPAAGSTTKHVIGINPFNEKVAGVDYDLGSATRIRLVTPRELGGNGATFVIYEDEYEMRLLERGALQRTVYPLQVCPTAVQSFPDTLITVALNTASNTLTWFDRRAFSNPVDIDALERYRTEVLQAWLDLIAELWQTLKNRFCDQLLIDCPSCSEKDVIYLGCLDLDANARVRQICEVEHRKYVHTFRTVEYWLSIIPIQQVIKLATEMFCCFDIPEWFKKIRLPNENDPNRFDCGRTPDLGVILETLRNFRQSTANTLVERGKLFRDYVFNRQVPATPIRPKSQPRELIALPVETAVDRLKEDGIEVNRVVDYQPDAARRSFATALTEFVPDQPVTIIQRDGRVAYFTSQLDTTDVRDIRKDVESLVRDTKDVREAAANAAAVREDVDAVKKQASELSSRVEQVAGATTDLPLLRQDLESARKLIVERDAAIRDLNAQLTDLQNANKTASARIDELTTGLESASKAVQQFEGLKSRLDKVEKFIRPPG